MTKRPTVGPAVPESGPLMKSNGASGDRASKSGVRVSYSIRAARDAPPMKFFSQASGTRYASVLPVVRSNLRMCCMLNKVYKMSVVTSRAQRTKSNTVGTLRTIYPRLPLTFNLLVNMAVMGSRLPVKMAVIFS